MEISETKNKHGAFTPDLDEFIDLCVKYQHAKPIAEYYKADRHTILNKADSLGIDLRIPRKVTEEQIAEIIASYYTATSTELAKKYDVSPSRITQIWANAGCVGKVNRSYYLDEDAFKTITPETAYLLGFIGADGCIHTFKDTRQDILSICIQQEDIKILNLFKKTLKTEKEIYIRNNRYATLQLSSNKLVSDIKALGINYKKTYGNTIADLSEEFMPHFIRGYFDGDGSISKHAKIVDSVVSISGYEANLQKIINYLEKRNIFSQFTWDKRYYTPASTGRFGALTLPNKTSIYSFLKLIYRDCGDYYMDRKKERADKFIEYIENSNNIRDKQIVIYYENAVRKLAS